MIRYECYEQMRTQPFPLFCRRLGRIIGFLLGNGDETDPGLPIQKRVWAFAIGGRFARREKRLPERVARFRCFWLVVVESG